MDIFDDKNINNFPIKKKMSIKKISAFVFIVFISLFFYFSLISSPKIENPVIIHIQKGDSLSKIADTLEKENVVKSGSFLRSTIVFLDKDRSVPVGDYYFDKPINIYKVALRLVGGEHNVESIKVTFPEGFKIEEMASLLEKKIPDFDKSEFLRQTKDLEGYLFPDTYFFFPMTTISEIVYEMKNNFDRSTKNILSGKENINEIITMASIVELEAKDHNDAPIIAGILWKRLDLGMPLQVDVWTETYKKKGLPENPIANPGLKSITATVNKEETPYLYYLHDKKGNIHLAKTYTEHKRNISKYLK